MPERYRHQRWHFYAFSTNAPAIVVTVSHIPFDRNGIKFYRNDGEISKSDEYAIQSANVEVPHQLSVGDLPETDNRVAEVYIRRYVALADLIFGLLNRSYVN